MYSKAGPFMVTGFFIMKKIALISDTHGLIPQDVLSHLETVDEIWHAGDLGEEAVLEQLESLGNYKAVYGNIDDHKIRIRSALDQFFQCESLRVYMTHIGGYPGKYNKRVRAILDETKPDIYICGHSHICKIMKDEKRKLIHINPGACGYKGFHIYRTIVLMTVDGSKITALRVVELGKRAKLS